MGLIFTFIICCFFGRFLFHAEIFLSKKKIKIIIFSFQKNNGKKKKYIIQIKNIFISFYFFFGKKKIKIMARKKDKYI